MTQIASSDIILSKDVCVAIFSYLFALIELPVFTKKELSTLVQCTVSSVGIIMLIIVNVKLIRAYRCFDTLHARLHLTKMWSKIERMDVGEDGWRYERCCGRIHDVNAEKLD